MGYRCERCHHEWIPRDFDSDPRICPKCKSAYWDRPAKKPMLSYEVFRDQIRDVLQTNGALTWTEIRTVAKLPQAFPNNQWVHRLENDIGLSRRRDAHGIILWSLNKPADVAAESANPPERVAKGTRRKQAPVE